MATFNIDSQDIYVIGCHGCSPNLYEHEDSDEFRHTRFFTVPENMMIVYFNPNGVLSIGNKNIPFIRNLYDYNRDMFNYIINPANYKINLDKSNPNSYRHEDFFKSLPFFSNFNYMCNFELYPPGTPCPFINLSFTMPDSSSKPSYFEGITTLSNINFEKFGQSLNFVNPELVYNPREHLKRSSGFIYTNNFFDLLNKQFGLNKGIFFISACRAEFFQDGQNTHLVDINPINRNCGDINYDTQFVDNLITQNPLFKIPLDNVKRKLIIRDKRKKDIDQLIIQSYLQSDSFYNKNFIHELYTLLNINIEHQNINLCINFSKSHFTGADLESKNYKGSLLMLTDKIFNSIRIGLIIKPNDADIQRRNIIENNNSSLETKLRFLYLFVFHYVKEYSKLPPFELFNDFFALIEQVYSQTQDKQQITTMLNTYLISPQNPKFNLNIQLGGTNTVYYKQKYLKYKEKYLRLKNYIKKLY